MQKTIAIVGVVFVCFSTGCEKDSAGLNPSGLPPAVLKLVGAASVNPEVASSVEKAEMFAELRLTSLIALAEGETATLRFEEASGKWKSEVNKAAQVSGLQIPEPVIKTNWLFLETEWRRSSTPPQASLSTNKNGKRFVIEITDVKDDLAVRLRAKAVKYVEAHAKTNNLKAVNWRQTLLQADCNETGEFPQFSGKMEIVLQE